MRSRNAAIVDENASAVHMAPAKSGIGLSARGGGLGSAGPIKPAAASAAPQQRSAMASVQKPGQVVQAAPRRALGDISNAQARSQPIGGPVKLQASLKPLPSPSPIASRAAPKLSAPIIQTLPSAALAAPLMSRSALLAEDELLAQYGLVDAPKRVPGRASPPPEEDELTRRTGEAIQRAVERAGGMFGNKNVSAAGHVLSVRPASPIPWSKSQEELDFNGQQHSATARR
jgi:hypothetical protein